jgi:hypothetical protein
MPTQVPAIYFETHSTAFCWLRKDGPVDHCDRRVSLSSETASTVVNTLCRNGLKYIRAHRAVSSWLPKSLRKTEADPSDA